MIGIQWTGTDGSTWDLLRGPVRTSVAGIGGMAMPPVQHYYQETAVLDGQRLTGYRVQPRPVFLPLRFRTLDVEGVQRAFWRSVRIGQQGRLTITDDNGATRSLSLRFEDDGNMAYHIDPHTFSEAFGLRFIADQPWWEGPAVTAYYSVGDSSPQFFDVGSSSNLFNIIPSSMSSSGLQLFNAGEEPAWPTWTIEGSSAGPATAYRLSVYGQIIEGTTRTIVGTQRVVIETDPRRQIARLGFRDPDVQTALRASPPPTNITRELSLIQFYPISPNSSAPIGIQLTGFGLVTGTIVPKYARAF